MPFGCPVCGAHLFAPQRSETATWRCADGHIFPTIRSLIAALLAAGWRPEIDLRQH